MTQGVSSDSQIFQFERKKKIEFIALAFTQQQATIKNSLSDFGISFDQIASVQYSSNVNTTSHNSMNQVISQQIGETVDYGAAGAVLTTEGYIKSGQVQQIQLLITR